MSGRSRGARDVLAEIRSVINHLERKDNALNEQLRTWKSVSGGSETETIQALVAENANLKEQVKEISDNSGKKMEEISRLRDENAHLQGSISAKDAEINKLTNNLNAQKNACDQMSKYYIDMKKDLERSQADLLDTKAEMNSYSSAYDSVFKEKSDLKTENESQKKIISALQATAASTDQTQLQIAYGDLSKEFNKVEAELKEIKPISDQNFQSANQWKNESEKRTKQIEILQAQIAKLRSGGAPAGSPDLVSLDPPPPPIAARLVVERAKDDTKDPIAIAKADNSQNNTASQQPVQKQSSYLGAAAGAVGTVLNAIGFGGGGRGTNSVDDISDEGDDIVAGSPSGGSEGRAAAGGARSDKVPPQFAVTTELKKDAIRDPVAAEAQEDYSNILDLTADKNTINTLYNKLNVLPFIPMDKNKSTSPAVMVNRILNSPQYQPHLKTTANKYNIDISLDDSTKIDLLYKYFGEYKRASEISIADFNTACSRLRKLQKSDEENCSKQQMLTMFHTLDSQERSQLSYCLFAVLNKDPLQIFAKSIGITSGSKKREIIDKLIEIPSTNWKGFVSGDIDSITNN